MALGIKVGDPVLYDGKEGTVVGFEPGEYGDKVVVKLDSGVTMATTPGLDHRWGQPEDSKVPTLTSVLWKGFDYGSEQDA
jgi:hypothetical protein